MVDLQQENNYMRIIDAPVLLPPTANNINSLVSENLTIKGNINIDNGTVTLNKGPTDSKDAVNKGYVDDFSKSVKWKNPSRVATTIPITLSGEQTIDGIAVTSGERVLVKDQADGIENGIYDVSSGSWSRSSDMLLSSSASNVALWIESGTTNGDNAFLCTNNSGSAIVGTDSLTFVVFSTTTIFIAGDGINISSTQEISVDNTVILTTGGQTITGTLGVTGTLEANNITDGTVTMTGGNITGLEDLAVDNMLTQSGTNQILSSNTIDGTNSNVNTQGDIILYNPTKNTIYFRDTGSGAPSFTTRSAGTKIVLKPAISASTVDMAIGVTGNDMWFSIPDSSSSFSYSRQGNSGLSTTLSGTGTINTIKTLFGMSGTVTATTFNMSGNTLSGGLLSTSRSTVTQLTSLTTSVNLNDATGTITTVSTTAVANSVSTFTVNNSIIDATTDCVHVQVTDYTGTYGTNGIPVISVSNLVVGSFDITIINAGSNAFNGAFDISFFIF